MLGLPPSVRIYFATEPTDMRKGIDGLRAIVEGTLRHDPYEGQYGASFLAHIAVAKCADHLPIYRLEKELARKGVPVALDDE